MSVPVIIPRILGGLGNQLFCYAAARRLALVNGAELAIDHVTGFRHDHVYKRKYQLDHFNIPCRKATARERLEPFSLVRHYMKKWLNKRLPFENQSYIQQEGNEFDPRLLQVKPKKRMHLKGYWQSEGYFKDVEETIRSDLRFIVLPDNMNQEMSKSINNCLSIAVHVRFFDASVSERNSNAMMNYYSCAVERMESMVKGAQYFLFSEHPSAARRLISLPEKRITCVSHNKSDDNAYADLWLMSQCKHFIIANSTFSWWGAWLAKSYERKIVIAPGDERLEGTRWGFKGLIPTAWITF